LAEDEKKLAEQRLENERKLTEKKLEEAKLEKEKEKIIFNQELQKKDKELKFKDYQIKKLRGINSQDNNEQIHNIIPSFNNSISLDSNKPFLNVCEFDKSIFEASISNIQPLENSSNDTFDNQNTINADLNILNANNKFEEQIKIKSKQSNNIFENFLIPKLTKNNQILKPLCDSINGDTADKTVNLDQIDQSNIKLKDQSTLKQNYPLVYRGSSKNKKLLKKKRLRLNINRKAKNMELITKMSDSLLKIDLESNKFEPVINKALATRKVKDMKYFQFNNKGKTYFVKTINKALKQNILQIFFEIHIANAIKHPNLMEIFAYYEDIGNVYLVYKSFGESLNKYVKTPKNLHFSVDKIFNQIVNGLSNLHDNNVIHRDIKPQNILISNGIVKICDFGLSIITCQENVLAGGTQNFRAPEFEDKIGASKASDIYALGCTLMFLYIPAFVTSTIFTKNKLMMMHLVSNKVHKDIIEKMISKNPKDRPTILEIKTIIYNVNIINTISSNQINCGEIIQEDWEETLSAKYKSLLTSFSYLDETLNFYKITNRISYLENIRLDIERNKQSNFDESIFLRILYIVPYLYVYKYIDDSDIKDRLLIGIALNSKKTINVLL